MSTQLDITDWSRVKREAAIEAANSREGWRILLIHDPPPPAETEADRLDQARLAELRRQSLRGGAKSYAARGKH
jgi:hypothetical protein